MSSNWCLSIIASGVILLTGCGSSDLDCSRCRTGTFQDEILPDTIATYERTDSSSTESVPALNRTARYRIRWVEPCTYQLFDRVSIRGTSSRQWAPEDTLTVQIVKVDHEGFDYVATHNSVGFKLQGRQVFKPTDQ